MHLTSLHMLWRCVFWRSMRLASCRRMLAGIAEDHDAERLELADRKKSLSRSHYGGAGR